MMASIKQAYRLRSQEQFYQAMFRAGLPDKHAFAEKAGISYTLATHLAVKRLSYMTVLKVSTALHTDTDDLFSKIKK